MKNIFGNTQLINNYGQLANMQNTASNSQQSYYSQQQGLQQGVLYNQAWLGQVQINRIETKWKFNGKDASVREMADMIWPSSCADKTHFILKYE